MSSPETIQTLSQQLVEHQADRLEVIREAVNAALAAVEPTPPTTEAETFIVAASSGSEVAKLEARILSTLRTWQYEVDSLTPTPAPVPAPEPEEEPEA